MGSLKNAWSFKNSNGRQLWFFDKQKAHEIAGTSDDVELFQRMDAEFIWDKTKNPNAQDSVYREKFARPVGQKPTNADEALDNGLRYFLSLLQEDGNWCGESGGPHFLLPGLVIATYCSNSMPDEAQLILMRRYFLNHQNEDGGWGLHIEGPSSMFGTALNLTGLVVAGQDIHSESVQRALQWIHTNGGVTGIPPWGKFYLALVGLYHWDGMDPLLPEMWLLPKWVPVYPGNYWNHARMVYLPMSYLYGRRLTKTDDNLLAFRDMLYQGNYDKVNWKKARRACCPIDDYYSETKLYSFASRIMSVLEKITWKGLRNKAFKNVAERIHAEDIHSDSVNLGPVNKVLNLLSVYYIDGADSPEFKKHRDRLEDYIWLSEDGIKMNMYNGTQLWDTCFMAQALMENPNRMPEINDALRKIDKFVDYTFLRDNRWEDNKFDRSPSIGGWPFSTMENGWPVTDCTSEGLRTVLGLHKLGLASNPQLVNDLTHSIDFLLLSQNHDGGWASYEVSRAGKWVEKMNPSRVFGDIMIDYSYTECSSACVQALLAYRKHNPDYRKAEVAKAIARGVEFIMNRQQEDGLWYANWGVCYTYATWFGIEAIVQSAGIHYDEKDSENPITKACQGLFSIQKADGSWGEVWQACAEKRYIENPDGQVVNTAWALMALFEAGYPIDEKVEQAIQFLVDRQIESGDWPQQNISGIFNLNCTTTYINYRNIFPIWALQRYMKARKSVR